MKKASEMKEIADTANHDLTIRHIDQEFARILEDIGNSAAAGLYKANTDYLSYEESKNYASRLHELGYTVDIITYPMRAYQDQPSYILSIKWG